MAAENEDVPPLVTKERRRGTLLTLIALAILLLVALIILLGDEIFSQAPPEETNITIETGGAEA